MKWLKGKKTILGMVGLGVLLIVRALELIDAQTAEIVGACILTWTGVSLRLAMKG